MNILQIFIFCILILFPLYFWAYALKILGEPLEVVRFKFWAGVFSGFFSVGIVFVFFHYFQNIFAPIFTIIFLVISYFFVWILSVFGSKFSQKFLQKTSHIHIISIFAIFILLIFFSKIFTNSFVFSGIIATIFVPAFFEEISKHFSTLGILGKKFSFSLREITLFTFCIVLGFVFVENILYLQKFGNNFGLALFRSIFTFSVHLLSSLVCVLAWWKALSYPFASWKYIGIFSLGFALSVGIHFICNIFLNAGKIIFLIPISILAYGMFVYLIKK